MLKLIIFDYDGVIVDSFPNVHKVYVKMCKAIGKECPKDFEEFKKLYGNSSKDFRSNMHLTKEESEQMDPLYKPLIMEYTHPLFTGISQLLKEVHKQYITVVISASLEDEVRQKLDYYDITQYFNDIIGQKGSSGRLSKVDAIKNVLDQYKVNPAEVLMIGDRKSDYEEAIDAGLANIQLVEYGWGYKHEEIPGYTNKYIVNKPQDILGAIEKINK